MHCIGKLFFRRFYMYSRKLVVIHLQNIKPPTGYWGYCTYAMLNECWVGDLQIFDYRVCVKLGVMFLRDLTEHINSECSRIGNTGTPGIKDVLTGLIRPDPF